MDLTRAIEIIKYFEGCKLVAYQCQAGVWTIGYGHTKTAKKGMKITQEQAEHLLAEEIKEFAGKFNNILLTANYLVINNNQYCALLSFFYNCGFAPQMVDRIQEKTDIEVIIEAMGLYINAGGKPSNGLIRRRKAEQSLARSGLWEKI